MRHRGIKQASPRPSPRLTSRARAALALSVVCWGLAACAPKVEQQIKEARVLLDQGQAEPAAQRLKEVLLAQPESGPGRVMLAEALLEGGYPAGAEIELRRAQELQVPPEQTLPLMARVMLARGQATALLAADWLKTPLNDAVAQAALYASVAEAHLSLGDEAAARTVLARALTTAPQSVPAQLLQARLEFQSGQLAQAQRRIDAVLAAQPKTAEAWILLAEVALRDGHQDQALSLYQRALKVRPDLLAAHEALITQHIAKRDAPAARQQVQALRKVLPRHPKTWLLDAQVAYLSGDLRQANDQYQSLLKLAPDDPLLLQSAGAVALRMGSAEQAERLLGRALQRGPDQAPGQAQPARLLLAQAQLQLGQNERALATLEPLLGADPPVPQAVLAAAQAHLLKGDAAAADALFRRVAQLKPEDPQLRTALAMAQLARGRPDQALAELQAVSASDPGVVADMALVSAHLQARRFDAALAAVEALDRKQPKEVLPAMVRGQVHLARQAPAAARQAFETALARDPGHEPAVAALARLDLADGQVAAARARYAALVQAQPNNSALRLAQAALMRQTGAQREEVTALLDAAMQSAPDEPALPRALIDHHLSSRNTQAALVLAQSASARWPEDPDLLLRLGQAQLATRDPRQAVATYSRLTQLLPRQALGFQALAEAHLAVPDLPAAQRAVARGLQLAPQAPALQRLQVQVALRQKQPDQALALARGVQSQRPQDAWGHLLEGEIALAERRWPDAVAALRRAVALRQPGPSAMRLHQALLRAGQPAEAEVFTRSWLKAHPTDTAFLHHLGDQALAKGDWPSARAHFEAVLQHQPAHASALNNLAWVMLQQRAPGATAMAERAVRAAPDEPGVLDTLALCLAQDGQAAQALAWSRRAVLLAPDHPDLRLTLATVLVQAGQKREAKAELERLTGLGEQFARQAEVTRLKQSL